MGAPDIPSMADPAQSAIAGAREDIANFPFRYQIEAAAKKGEKYTDPVTGKVYDFTGLGDADNAGVISDKMAQTLLDIQKGYGAEFVKQRVEDLKRSDPTGYAARKQFFDKVMADADAHPDRPLAENLQSQVKDMLSRGGKLDNRQLEQVQEGVRGKQVKSGIYLGNAPAVEESTAVVNAGEQQRTNRQNQSLDFLKSGISPDDVEYRRIQQTLSNLGNFVSGTSPIAEFGSLSGAQGGAAPFTTTGGVNQQTNPNAALQGQQNAQQIYGQQVNFANSQANPWMAGVSTGVSALSAAANLGYNPWSGRPNTGTGGIGATGQMLP